MGEKEKEKKKTLDYKDDNITMHQKFVNKNKTIKK